MIKKKQNNPLFDFVKNKLKNSNLFKDKYLLALIILFVVMVPVFLTPWVHGNDGAGYYSYVHSIFIDHDLDFENEREHFNQTQSVTSINIDPKTGNHYNHYPLGTALLWSPYYVFGHLIAYLGDFPMDGYFSPYVYMICLGSAINAFIGILLIYFLLRKYFKKAIAFLSLVTVWLASPLFYYMFFESSLSHANSFFAATIFVYFWHASSNERSVLKWSLLGLLAGLMVLVRFQNVIFLVFPLIEVITKYKSGTWKEFTSSDLKGIIFSALSFILVLTPQMLILKASHGSIIRGYQVITYGNKLNLLTSASNFFNVLFSSNHGLINWCPVLGLALIGLFMFYRKEKKLSLMFLSAFFLNLIIVSGWEFWHASQSFGHRMFINLTMAFVFGFAYLLEYLERKVGFKYILVTCLFLIGWNFGLMVQYGSRMISSGGAVPLLERVYNNFVEVPRKIFKLISKFIFFRGEFLK
jgi:hypothetical protein